MWLYGLFGKKSSVITVRPSSANNSMELLSIIRDKFIELAINGKASLIITGDEDLLVLNNFEGIEILTPKEFVTKLS